MRSAQGALQEISSLGRIDQGKTNYGLRKDWLLMERRLSVLVLTFLLLLGVNLTGAVAAQSEIKAPVAAVDKYGNITLDLMTQVLFDAGFEFGDLVTVQVDEHSITAPLSRPTVMST